MSVTRACCIVAACAALLALEIAEYRVIDFLVGSWN